MIEARPSRTALRVAMRRAAHQLFDTPKVLDDPIALRIIGPKAAAKLETGGFGEGNRLAQGLRAFMAARSRYAEDALARSLGRGATQYVVLGAGLDTFAYRNPYGESTLRVFEVDYPATQEWKRQQLEAARIAIPPSVNFAPVDFEHQTLAEGMRLAGLDPTKATFFSWLGVTMYLTEEAATSTFAFIASTPPGGGVVFDYAVPRSSLGLLGRVALDAMMWRVAATGEPFRTFFEPAALAERLRGMGFKSIEDLGADEINSRYFKDRADKLRIMGQLGRLMSAEL
ncbi:MAG: class I SAM-dependent methyltransferase [Candidatus Acidoferrales bacterium]|nr:class I SAM-dependent methyltransferase [Candidatus Acidoferrales bacterium]